MKFKGSHIVLFDTEYTTWEGALERNWSEPNEHKEVIQIGAVLVDTNSFNEIDTFKVYVMPVKNPKLSEYAKDLTGITQEDIDAKGMDLKIALEKLDEFSQGADFYSWGEDGKVMAENCEIINIDFPINQERFFDIRSAFAEEGIQVEKYLSSTIPEAFGEYNENKHHDALGDAQSILLALRKLRA